MDRHFLVLSAFVFTLFATLCFSIILQCSYPVVVFILFFYTFCYTASGLPSVFLKRILYKGQECLFSIQTHGHVCGDWKYFHQLNQSFFVNMVWKKNCFLSWGWWPGRQMGVGQCCITQTEISIIGSLRHMTIMSFRFSSRITFLFYSRCQKSSEID